MKKILIDIIAITLIVLGFIYIDFFWLWLILGYIIYCGLFVKDTPTTTTTTKPRFTSYEFREMNKGKRLVKVKPRWHDYYLQKGYIQGYMGKHVAVMFQDGAIKQLYSWDLEIIS